VTWDIGPYYSAQSLHGHSVLLGLVVSTSVIYFALCWLGMYQDSMTYCAIALCIIISYFLHILYLDHPVIPMGPTQSMCYFAVGFFLAQA